jgi:hypothetical protein
MLDVAAVAASKEKAGFFPALPKPPPEAGFFVENQQS